MATVIGQTVSVNTGIAQLHTTNPSGAVDFPVISISINKQKQYNILERAKQIDFLTLPQEDIALLCSEVEKSFSTTLNKCLEKVDNINSHKLVRMIKTLSESVDSAKLGEVADKILLGKPSFFENAKLHITAALNKKSASDIKDVFFEETKDLLKQKANTLLTLITSMEGELDTEIHKIDANVAEMHNISEMYKEYFEKYIDEAAFILVLYEIAKKQVDQYKDEYDLNDPINQRAYQVLNDKLRALENSALVMEGQVTSLPTDDMVFRQLQLASISTRQDALTTIPARFNKIKMTLLKLNSALIIKGAQDLDNQSKKLDATLSHITSGMIKDVVSQAANAAGENRKAQAEQIMLVVNETKELVRIAEEGAANNQKNFNEARTLFASARSLLAELNQKSISRS